MKRVPAAFLMALAALLFAAPGRSAPTLVKTLENGLEVAIFRDPRLPVVQIHALAAAGTRHEGPLEGGVARVTALLLTRGTTSRSASVFASDVEQLGGTMAGITAADYASLTAGFRAQDLEAGLELVADALIHPLFDESEIESARDEILRTLLQTRRHLAFVADEHLRAAAMAGTPYAMPELATPEALASLTRARVSGFHRSRYRPDAVKLAISGDVDAERALALVREHFGSWSGKATAPEAVRTPQPAPAIRLVDAPGSREAEIRIGFATPGRTAEDAYPLLVAHELLGAGPTSRLGRGQGRVLRTYGTFQLWRDAGMISLGAVAQAESLAWYLDRLRSEARRFASEPPSEAEVAAARRAMARSHEVQNESSGARAAQWVLSRLVEPGAAEYAERLSAVRADQVGAAAGRWLDPGRAQVVVVGAASELKAALEKLGPVTVVSVQSPPVEIAIAPSRRMDEPGEEEKRRGRSLAEKAVAAHGGLPRLRAVRDSRVESEVTLHSQGQSMSGRMIEMRREPDLLRVESVFPQVSTVQALDHGKAWVRVAAGDRDSTFDEDAEGAAGLRQVFRGDLVHVLLATADPKSRLAHRGREAVGAVEAEVVEMVDAEGVRRVLFLDPSSQRLVALEQNQGSALRAPTLRRVLSQYRTVGSILWPHSEERLVNGARTMTVATRKVEINTGIDEEAFRKPDGTTTGTHRRR